MRGCRPQIAKARSDTPSRLPRPSPTAPKERLRGRYPGATPPPDLSRPSAKADGYGNGAHSPGECSLPNVNMTRIYESDHLANILKCGEKSSFPLSKRYIIISLLFEELFHSLLVRMRGWAGVCFPFERRSRHGTGRRSFCIQYPTEVLVG